MTTTDLKTGRPETTSKPEGETPASRVDELTASVRDLASQLEDGSTRLASRVPAAVDAVKVTARDAAQTVETLPEPTRLMLASLSLGLGAGLFVTGAPRLLTLLAFSPAMAVVGTWMVRAPRPLVH